MSDDEYRNGFGDDNAPVEKTPEEMAAEEAKAEEEFISTPEDHVENPLVPEEPKEDDSEDEDRLKGAIGSGNLAADYPEEEKELASNEDNMADSIVNDASSASDSTPEVENAPVQTDTIETAVAEPTVEEKPAATTVESVGTTTTTESIADMAAQTNTAAPKKKSKAGLIITLIIVALLLIGGVVGFFIWMSIVEAPENALKDSLAKFWTSENVQMSGNFTMDNDGTKYEISFDGAKSEGNIGGSGKIKTKYNGANVDIDFSASYIKGGTLYAKIDGLEKVVKSLNLGSDSSSVMGGYSELLSSILGTVVETIDGQWYKIAASDLKDVSAAEGLSCMLENLDGAVSKDSMQSVADVYKKHPFIAMDKDAEVKEEDGVKYIPVTVNKDDSKKFIDELRKIDGFKKIAACSESESEDDDLDFDEEDSDNTKMTLGVKAWSHELVSAELEKDGDNAGKLSAKMSYDKKEVAAPNDAKSISELGTEIEKSLKTAMTSYVDKLCSQTYASYGQNYVDLCKQSAMNQMGDFDISQMLGGLLGSSI